MPAKLVTGLPQKQILRISHCVNTTCISGTWVQCKTQQKHVRKVGIVGVWTAPGGGYLPKVMSEIWKDLLKGKGMCERKARNGDWRGTFCLARVCSG